MGIPWNSAGLRIFKIQNIKSPKKLGDFFLFQEDDKTSVRQLPLPAKNRYIWDLIKLL